MSMRIILEARQGGSVHRVERDARTDNWRDEARNNAERRQGVIDAANDMLRCLNLAEIAEAQP